MGEDPDQDRGDDRQHQVATVIEGEVIVVDLKEAVEDVGEGDHPGAIEQWPTPAPGRSTSQGPRVPEERQGHSAQQTDRVGVGAVIDPRGIGTRMKEHPGQRHRPEGASDDAEDQPFAAKQGHPSGEDQRPKKVELLLDREGPEVAKQRRRLELFEIGLVAIDEMPVGDVEEGGQGVAAQLVDPARLDDRRDHHRHRDEDADRGQQAPRPTPPELAHLDVPTAAVLAEQKRGDQVAADHEEDVDAEEAARHPADA